MTARSYAVLADVVLVLHAVYVGVVVLAVPLIIVGGRLGWRWVTDRRIRYGHLAMIGIVVGEALLGVHCPLTVWERALRRAGGAAVDRHDFIAGFFDRLLFYDFPPWVFTLAYVGFGLLVLALFAIVPLAPRRCD